LMRFRRAAADTAAAASDWAAKSDTRPHNQHFSSFEATQVYTTLAVVKAGLV
jgi:hypothetical protein